ncbi:MAG: MFS transporter, partial [Dehalococcoidia bacterium]|nr:MFS transporter [Dehalococcoidia bacterium]
MLIIRKRFFHGWAIVAALFLVGFAEVVTFNPVLAVMMKPMAAEMGWSRTAIVGALSAGSVVSGGVALIVGPILDRRGARGTLVLGIAIMGLCLIGISQVTALWQFYMLFGLARAISAGIVELAISVTIANWFINKRARAFGIATTGPRIGLACIPPLALLLMSGMGWRGAWVGLGITTWLMGILPAVLFLGRRPEDFGLVPDGHTNRQRALPPDSQHSHSLKVENIKETERSWTVRNAVGSMTFWLL